MNLDVRAQRILRAFFIRLIFMETKKNYKIQVDNRIFSVYAYTIYHAIDKLYTKYYDVEKDRSKYKLIK